MVTLLLNTAENPSSHAMWKCQAAQPPRHTALLCRVRNVPAGLIRGWLIWTYVQFWINIPIALTAPLRLAMGLALYELLHHYNAALT